MDGSLSPSRAFAPCCTRRWPTSKERRELQEKVADLERDGHELQEELDRRDEADGDIGAAFVELCNALGDRVAMTFWPIRLRLMLEGVPAARSSTPWVNR